VPPALVPAMPPVPVVPPRAPPAPVVPAMPPVPVVPPRAPPAPVVPAMPPAPVVPPRAPPAPVVPDAPAVPVVPDAPAVPVVPDAPAVPVVPATLPPAPLAPVVPPRPAAAVPPAPPLPPLLSSPPHAYPSSRTAVNPSRHATPERRFLALSMGGPPSPGAEGWAELSRYISADPGSASSLVPSGPPRGSKTKTRKCGNRLSRFARPLNPRDRNVLRARAPARRPSGSRCPPACSRRRAPRSGGCGAWPSR